MKILFLGHKDTAKELAEWLISQGEEVIYREDETDVSYVKAMRPDFIISYNYQYIIPKEIIDFLKKKAINLHISLLPWNRGSYPNIWSFLKDTPKGVSIICIDAGVDTGDILVQKEIFFEENKETLKSSYEKLHDEIQILFKKKWEKIKRAQIRPQKQKGRGSFHYAREYAAIIKPLIRESGWDISIKELKEKYENN